MNATTLMTDDCKAYIKSINKIKTTKNVKAKKLSGYNVFCMEQRKNMEGSPTEIMTKLGGMWKECTDSKKETYKKKCEKLNIVAAKEAEKILIEDDFQTLELKVQVETLIKQFKKSLVKKAKDEQNNETENIS
jgi:hypothetical protein